MKKKTQNYFLFIILFSLGLFQAVSGFVLWFALPHSGGGGRGSGSIATFWALSRDTWISLHDWVSVLLVIVVILHIILHWTWIVHMTKSYFKS